MWGLASTDAIYVYGYFWFMARERRTALLRTRNKLRDSEQHVWEREVKVNVLSFAAQKWMTLFERSFERGRSSALGADRPVVLFRLRLCWVYVLGKVEHMLWWTQNAWNADRRNILFAAQKAWDLFETLKTSSVLSRPRGGVTAGYGYSMLCY